MLEILVEKLCESLLSLVVCETYSSTSNMPHILYIRYFVWELVFDRIEGRVEDFDPQDFHPRPCHTKEE